MCFNNFQKNGAISEEQNLEDKGKYFSARLPVTHRSEHFCGLAQGAEARVTSIKINSIAPAYGSVAARGRPSSTTWRGQD
jgi:hypothetical protein